jgi:hypothetical protein
MQCTSGHTTRKRLRRAPPPLLRASHPCSALPPLLLAPPGARRAPAVPERRPRGHIHHGRLHHRRGHGRVLCREEPRPHEAHGHQPQEDGRGRARRPRELRGRGACAAVAVQLAGRRHCGGGLRRAHVCVLHFWGPHRVHHEARGGHEGGRGVGCGGLGATRAHTWSCVFSRCWRQRATTWRVAAPWRQRANTWRVAALIRPDPSTPFRTRATSSRAMVACWTASTLTFSRERLCARMGLRQHWHMVEACQTGRACSEQLMAVAHAAASSQQALAPGNVLTACART